MYLRLKLLLDLEREIEMFDLIGNFNSALLAYNKTVTRATDPAI